jgi:hypothetical protein
MKKFSTYLVLAVLGLAAVGCSDDSDDTAAPSKTSLLTAKSWQLTDVKANGQSIFMAPLFDTCDKDDFITFKADKSAVYDEGADKCDPAANQTSTGSWEFTNNESKLKMTSPDGEVLEGTINTLTSTKLVVSGTQEILGVPVPAELTFTAK